MIERQTKSQIPYQCGRFSRIIQSFVSQIQITCKEALPSCMPKIIIQDAEKDNFLVFVIN